MNKLINSIKDAYKHATSANKERKDRIVLNLINNTERTLIVVQLYRGMTEEVKPYTKKFQSFKPQAYELHSDLQELIRTFMANFIIPVKIPLKSSSKLAHLNVKDQGIQVQDKLLGTGKYCADLICVLEKNTPRHGKWLKKLYTSLREGYESAANYMQKNMPLKNDILKNLTYLDPYMQRTTNTATALKELADKLPQIIKKEEIGSLEMEIKKYTTNPTLATTPVDKTKETYRVDTDWWVKAFSIKTDEGTPMFPLLAKLVKALLTIYSGPVVESSFNVMSDIIEDDRARITTYNFEALAMIKSFVSSRSSSSTSLIVSKAMKNDICLSYETYQNFLKGETPKSRNSTLGNHQSLSKNADQSKFTSNCKQSTNHFRKTNSTISAVEPHKSQPDSHPNSHGAQPVSNRSETQPDSLKRKQSSLFGFLIKKSKTQ